ncbi:MAG: alpha-mannosidase, partial [Planctomycetes bacterium]|nr:alpha-mannosidase [Planctomycetota bacterium]
MGEVTMLAQPAADISTALARLRTAADHSSRQFPATRWTKVSGPGPEAYELNVWGGFQGLALERGQELVIRCALELPAAVGAVELAGDPLECTLNSLYPTVVTHDGRPLFADAGIPIAAGPALFTVIPRLKGGANGVVEIRFRMPDNQVSNSCNFKLTTPRLRALTEVLDVMWSELWWCEQLAATAADRALVAQAAAFVPEAPLAAGQARLDEALARIESILSPFAARAKATPVHLVGHSHIDMNWLWTWRDTVEVIKRDVDSVVAMMADYPELTFSHSQPATYEVLRAERPDLFARVKELIAAGRWEAMTMQWVEGDTNMASGEAAARHLLEGAWYAREMLGTTSTTYHAPDTFGHAGNLPQLAVSAGAQRYYHHRCNPGQEHFWPAYWWEGIDGSRILGVTTPSYNGDITARDLVGTAARSRTLGHPCGLHFHGIGDHGGGPARQNLDALRRFQKRPLMPTAFCSTMAAYTGSILDSGVALPTHRGESSTIFEGCYTTHADAKRHNRHGENLLCTADSLAAAAGLDRTRELTPAWRTVLFNQFHDILDGAAIHESYVLNQEHFEQVRAAADAVTTAALDVLQAGIAEDRIAVTNPLGFAREDWVMVLVDAMGVATGEEKSGPVRLIGADGHTAIGQRTAEGIGFVARTPAFGTTSYRIEAADAADAADRELTVAAAFAPADPRIHWCSAAETDKDGGYYRVETPFFSCLVRRDSGIIGFLKDKRADRQLVGYGVRHHTSYQDSVRADLALNVLTLTDELPHEMSAWHLDEVHRETTLLRGATASILESGPARVVIAVEHTVRASKIRQKLIFYRDLARIDFETAVDWQEVGSAQAGVPGLRVAFTARLPEAEAWFETPFAAEKRPCDGQEVPALRWADVGGETYGIAVINDSKYGYDALGTRLRLNLIRSGYNPDAISDVGSHTIRYSLMPHAGGWREAGVVPAAAGFN